MNERYLHPLGIIGGWSSGIMAYLNIVKDIVGLVGVVAGAVLSLWALYDRIKKHRASKGQSE